MGPRSVGDRPLGALGTASASCVHVCMRTPRRQDKGTVSEPPAQYIHVCCVTPMLFVNSTSTTFLALPTVTTAWCIALGPLWPSVAVTHTQLIIDLVTSSPSRDDTYTLLKRIAGR